ncbi:MAG: NAD(P)/FAD-dependent oxidoreductase [Gemmatimonadales bacterium]
MTGTGERVGIVGGGILGMTLAHRLRAAGMQPTILEAAPHSGGLASSQSIGGYTWDRFYHVILLSDGHLRGLLDELGVSEQLRWGTTRTGFYTDERLYSMSDVLEFLRFPPLSLVDKLRLAGTIMYASRLRDWKRLESIPVTEWLSNLSGRHTFERIWLPLLRSKLGDNYRLASAAFIWAIIARMYAARRSGLKKEMFGYVEGGYDVILRRFRDRLEADGVDILCGRNVTNVHDLGSEVAVQFESGERRLFDKLILTISAPRVAAVCPQLSESERERLHRVVYQGIICGSLLLRKPLADFYVTNITEDWVPFTAVIEMTALVDRAHFGGHSLVYLPRYVTQQDPAWETSDDALWEANFKALERMYPGFDRRDVVATQTARVREMLAVSTLGYSDSAAPPLTTSMPNVYVANSAQIANGTLNVEETVTLAEQQARALASHFRRGLAAPA